MRKVGFVIAVLSITLFSTGCLTFKQLVERVTRKQPDHFIGGTHQAPLSPDPRYNEFGADARTGVEPVASLAAGGKVQVTLSGTGRTIGHVINMKVKNLTKETLLVGIPPMVYASASGEKQPYLDVDGQSGELKPAADRIFEISGICANGRKPAAGQEDHGDLIMSNPSPAQQAMIDKIRHIRKTAIQLQRDRAFTTPFSYDPRKELETIIQWATWVHMSNLEGNPITKDDLARKVYEQTGKLAGKESSEMDKGIDQIWAVVQLIGAKPM